MILLPSIRETDLDSLHRFSNIPGLFNLPNDRDLLADKIKRSVRSFQAPAETIKTDGKYLFVAEDLKTGQVVGTSMIAGQHGTLESPHFFFEVGSEEKFSETINTGFIHGTLRLKWDTNGPTEIGGLVLDPECRNSPERVGRQISFVRFLYLAMNRSRFKKKILAELLPPLNQRGQSPLWEAIGRRFTSMDYWEADQLCQQNKEFIFSLFPSGKIYTTFLPAEARHALGKVGKDTEPVLHMLKKIGFTYRNQVDPFDGGPHLWASVDELLPVKQMRVLQVQMGSAQDSDGQHTGLLSSTSSGVEGFKAVAVRGKVDGSALRISEAELTVLAQVLNVHPGDSVVYTPFY